MYHQPFYGHMGMHATYVHAPQHMPMGMPQPMGYAQGNAGYAPPAVMGPACAPLQGAPPVCYASPGQQLAWYGHGAGPVGPFGCDPYAQPIPFPCMGAGVPGPGYSVPTSAAAAPPAGQQPMRAAKPMTTASHLRRIRNAERQEQIQSLVGKLAAEINCSVQGKAFEPRREEAPAAEEER